MRLGIIADIHEHFEHANVLLDALERESIDECLCLGDVVGHGKRLDETCRVLRKHRVRSVWGNHDYGLVVDPEVESLPPVEPATLDYMRSMTPSILLQNDSDEMLRAGVHLSHCGPWVDTSDVAEMWLARPPEDPNLLAADLNNTPAALFFIGHHHRWGCFENGVRTTWEGEAPLHINPLKKTLVVVQAAFLNGAAVLDTSKSVLFTIRIGLPDGRS